jgi:hypothetical protein
VPRLLSIGRALLSGLIENASPDDRTDLTRTRALALYQAVAVDQFAGCVPRVLESTGLSGSFSRREKPPLGIFVFFFGRATAKRTCAIRRYDPSCERGPNWSRNMPMRVCE